MVHFDFVLSDVDADNLFGCIDDSILRLQDDLFLKQITKSIATDEEVIAWYKKRIGYLSELKSKMKCKMEGKDEMARETY